MRPYVCVYGLECSDCGVNKYERVLHCAVTAQLSALVLFWLWDFFLSPSPCSCSTTSSSTPLHPNCGFAFCLPLCPIPRHSAADRLR